MDALGDSYVQSFMQHPYLACATALAACFLFEFVFGERR